MESLISQGSEQWNNLVLQQSLSFFFWRWIHFDCEHFRSRKLLFLGKIFSNWSHWMACFPLPHLSPRRTLRQTPEANSLQPQSVHRITIFLGYEMRRQRRLMSFHVGFTQHIWHVVEWVNNLCWRVLRKHYVSWYICQYAVSLIDFLRTVRTGASAQSLEHSLTRSSVLRRSTGHIHILATADKDSDVYFDPDIGFFCIISCIIPRNDSDVKCSRFSIPG